MGQTPSHNATSKNIGSGVELEHQQNHNMSRTDMSSPVEQKTKRRKRKNQASQLESPPTKNTKIEPPSSPFGIGSHQHGLRNQTPDNDDAAASSQLLSEATSPRKGYTGGQPPQNWENTATSEAGKIGNKRKRANTPPSLMSDLSPNTQRSFLTSSTQKHNDDGQSSKAPNPQKNKRGRPSKKDSLLSGKTSSQQNATPSQGHDLRASKVTPGVVQETGDAGNHATRSHRKVLDQVNGDGQQLANPTQIPSSAPKPHKAKRLRREIQAPIYDDDFVDPQPSASLGISSVPPTGRIPTAHASQENAASMPANDVDSFFEAARKRKAKPRNGKENPKSGGHPQASMEITSQGSQLSREQEFMQGIQHSTTDTEASHRPKLVSDIPSREPSKSPEREPVAVRNKSIHEAESNTGSSTNETSIAELPSSPKQQAKGEDAAKEDAGSLATPQAKRKNEVVRSRPNSAQKTYSGANSGKTRLSSKRGSGAFTAINAREDTSDLDDESAGEGEREDTQIEEPQEDREATADEESDTGSTSVYEGEEKGDSEAESERSASPTAAPTPNKPSSGRKINPNHTPNSRPNAKQPAKKDTIKDVPVRNTTTTTKKWSRKTPTKRRQFQDEGGPSGTFSEDQLARLDDFKDRYCEMNSISSRTFNERIQHTETDVPIWKRELWTSVYEVLPEREHRSLQRVCRRRYHNFKRQFKWTEEEEQELKDLVLEKGPKWKEIGSLLDRSQDDVINRWKNYLNSNSAGTQNMGPWSLEESNKLREIVREARQALLDARRQDREEKGLAPLEDDNEQGLPKLSFTAIAQRMGDRNRLQCLHKWKKMVARGQQDGGDLDETPARKKEGNGKGGARTRRPKSKPTTPKSKTKAMPKSVEFVRESAEPLSFSDEE